MEIFFFLKRSIVLLFSNYQKTRTKKKKIDVKACQLKYSNVLYLFKSTLKSMKEANKRQMHKCWLPKFHSFIKEKTYSLIVRYDTNVIIID